MPVSDSTRSKEGHIDLDAIRQHQEAFALQLQSLTEQQSRTSADLREILSVLRPDKGGSSGTGGPQPTSPDTRPYSSNYLTLRRLLEVEPPDPLRYFIGVAIMMVRVVFPIVYMMFRSKRVRSSDTTQ
ncbi:hypothetical protein KSP39_PZI008352 [Platanthera zijinensis]|uniref:Uncharacterized protein n=1 Tax=Platanthera zijinensis TaxID=2320716 RepID=A0AAP0BNX1_9ASPA